MPLFGLLELGNIFKSDPQNPDVDAAVGDQCDLHSFSLFIHGHRSAVRTSFNGFGVRWIQTESNT
ncbi:MAG: hypothetical protein MJE68_18465, partial [Proteobacteria bacterium]|nr:hypothetical protein [Pseudomonadota bacterium]